MPRVLYGKAVCGEGFPLREVCLVNPPLLNPPPPRGRKWADNPHLLLPWWEEVGRRGFLYLTGGPLGHEEL
jgi:hypothetical protein